MLTDPSHAEEALRVGVRWIFGVHSRHTRPSIETGSVKTADPQNTAEIRDETPTLAIQSSNGLTPIPEGRRYTKRPLVTHG
jgi:hypothetical protein